jgi:curved DNA-binding protein
MSVKFKDYYETLGVSRKATQEEIQRAYRKLARTWHPDVNKGKDAQVKFAEIGEAYEVLKDPEKRKKYDQLGADWKSGQDFRPPPGFEGFHFDFGGNTSPGGGRGYSSRGGAFSPGGFSEFFEAIFGQQAGALGGAGNGDPFARASTGGRTQQAPLQEVEIDVTVEDLYFGGTRHLTLQDETGRQKRLDVKIPAGAKQGSKIRLTGEGLLLKLRVQPHSRFRVDGYDMTTALKLSPWEAALGAEIDVPLMEGSVTLKVPAGSNSGQRLRVREQGLKLKDGKRGDLFVELSIASPKLLSNEERELFEKLRDTSDFNPRSKAD